MIEIIIHFIVLEVVLIIQPKEKHKNINRNIMHRVKEIE